jgi:hypothetical protein
MAHFPAIQRPCPYLDRLDSVIEGDFCRMCRRDVHDLTFMDDRERADFLAACGGDACVSYRMKVKPALAAAMIAASAAVLVAPEAALAASHHAGRSHQRHRQRPVQVQPVMIQVAGGIMPPEPLRGPVPPPSPPAPPVRPQKPD